MFSADSGQIFEKKPKTSAPANVRGGLIARFPQTLGDRRGTPCKGRPSGQYRGAQDRQPCTHIHT